MFVAKGHDRLANRLRRRWRPRILERDGIVCRTGCMDGPYPEDFLHIAHVTSASAFRHAFGAEAGTEASFREDNLVVLCEGCHMVQTDLEFGLLRPMSADGKRWFDEVESEAVHDGTDLRRKHWYTKRVALVQDLFASIQQQRGWTTVDEFAALHGTLTPTPPPEPETATDPGTHPEGSGIDWADLPATYREAKRAMEYAFRDRGVRVLAEGQAEEFVAYYDSFGPNPYLFTHLDAPTLLVQQPDGRAFIHAMKRRLPEGPGFPVVRQLRLGNALYLLHLHDH